MAGALAAIESLSGFLYSVTATDPIAFGGVALLLALLAAPSLRGGPSASIPWPRFA
jgi:hypothetical protein